MRVGIQAGDCGKTKLDAERRAIAVVGDIGVFEAPRRYLGELGIEGAERMDEGKTTNSHEGRRL
jgi:hypothetical protein